MILVLLAAALQAQVATKPKYAFEERVAKEPAGEIESVVLHPSFRDAFLCGDHAAGQQSIAGDALGTDCQVLGGVRGPNRSFGRLYRTDGATNEDWFSWGADVLSPSDGIVVGLLPNPKVNPVGTKGKPPAGTIQIKRDDGVTVMYGHLTEFQVALGDRVKAGEVIAKVDNNGPSWAPHVHAGAARGDVPLQIRWDQRAMAKLQAQ